MTLVNLQKSLVHITQSLVEIEQHQGDAEQTLKRELLPRSSLLGPCQMLHQLQSLRKNTLDIIFKILEQKQIEIEHLQQKSQQVLLQWSETGLARVSKADRVLQLTSDVIQGQISMNKVRMLDLRCHQRC